MESFWETPKLRTVILGILACLIFGVIVALASNP